MELDWAAESEFGAIQWAAFLHRTNISQSDMTSGHRVVLTYTLCWTSRCIGKGPGILSILDVTPHPCYRAPEAADSKTDPSEELTLGFTCTGTHPYPIIRRSPSAGLLVYHILTRLAGSARTHVVLAPWPPQEFQTHHAAASADRVIPDSQGDEDDDIDGDVQDANGLLPAGLTLASTPAATAPDPLGDDARWLNHSPWMPGAGPAWERVTVEVEPGEEEGERGVKVYLSLTVIVATLAPREEHRPTVTAGEKRKCSPEDSHESLAPGDEGHVEFDLDLDLHDPKRTPREGGHSQSTTRSSQCTTNSSQCTISSSLQ